MTSYGICRDCGKVVSIFIPAGPDPFGRPKKVAIPALHYRGMFTCIGSGVVPGTARRE